MTSREAGHCCRFFDAALLLLAIGVAQAETPRQIPAAPSLPVFVRDSDQRSLNVAPRTSTLGTARTIFANGCTGIATLDESRVASGILAVRINPSVFECGQPARILPFTPRTTGKLRVIMMLPDGSTESEVEMETVAAAHSTVNIDGMWYDPDTTGSGISFHHAAASDAVFGTWFLFAGAPAKGPKWYALQGMQWTAGGSLLVGMAYEVAAPTKPACAAGDDCPRLATSVLPVGSVGVSVLDANNLRVEAIDHYGRPAFVSFVKRLQF